ncbi:hypothetical protein HYFRA_00008651 [Hymenoscyphus fraxineus]|uniref:Uncharacterized protein n=1 Tax=Hymenoscyphus fraxineus TaxID=746836 RepID=A0A9N9KZS2_9HELO|nr:hypothetical protein HYFRA_00008651 [Hymenoscyphus fraxineus]
MTQQISRTQLENFLLTLYVAPQELANFFAPNTMFRFHNYGRVDWHLEDEKPQAVLYLGQQQAWTFNWPPTADIILRNHSYDSFEEGEVGCHRIAVVNSAARLVEKHGDEEGRVRVLVYSAETYSIKLIFSEYGLVLI